jgi:hypothetical protein
MNTPLLHTSASHMPKAWRAVIATVRGDGAAETCVQLIAEAAARRRIDPNGWTLHHANCAIDILSGLPRSETRCRRLRGLARRLAAAEHRRHAEAARARRAAELARRPKQLEIEFPPPRRNSNYSGA